MNYRAWQLKNADTAGENALLAAGYGPLLARVLACRGIAQPQAAAALLEEEPPLSDPFLLKDMDKAVARIQQAIENGETIVIFGDYDVDGVSATAILYECLTNLGAQVRCKLPTREGGGYGLNRETLQKLADKGYKLIVTVDNGISAIEEADLAAELGIELVITDHHLPAQQLPKAVAVVDPKREDDTSPFKDLCGAGVAFKLCAALEGCEDPAELLEPFGEPAALGISNIKEELEDRSLQYLDPVGYNMIRSLLNKHGDDFLNDICATIQEHLVQNGIHGATIRHRVKSIYGIYRKMYMQNKDFEEIYDIYAVRIIIDTVAECYTALGLIHDMYHPLPNRFKDYISTPKPNGYQSLHTTVIGREAIPFEVQIRTREMDRNAEYGIAAHWKYKAGITAASSDRLDERLAWVRQLLESQRSSIDATDLLSDIKSDLLPEEVFAFTPRGDVINLPAGATVIDFAYAIHSAVGNRMIGAKVNNRIVPIDHQVVTGEIIEIITGPENRGPSRDWLNIVKTSEAKNKIRNWFKKERRDENIAEGKDAFEKELRRNLMVIPPEQYDEFMSNLARRNHCNSVDEMYAAIGYGGLQLARILPKLKEEYTRLKATEPKPLPTVDIKRVHSSDGVVVEGIDNCPIKFAKCCSPLPGDDIIGFVTRGFGVSIHKRDCANVQQSMKDPENAARWVKAYWADDAKEDYKATLELDCMDRANLLSDVALALGDMRVPIYSLSARAADQGRARMSLTVGIMNTVHLNNVVARLRKVKDVLTVTRN